MSRDNRELDRQIGALIKCHGIIALESALNRIARPRRGRKPEQDHIPLQEHTIKDAVDFLNGLDPLALRSNTSIANKASREHPGHSQSATHRRIMRKLAKDRTHEMLRAAMVISFDRFPYAKHLWAIDQLCERDCQWIETQQSAQRLVAIYRSRFEEPPEAMTFQEMQLASLP